MSSFITTLLVRLLLPLTLLGAFTVRISLTSLVYGIFFLLVPVLPLPKPGRIGPLVLQAILLIFSTLVVLSQAAFHISLAAIPPYGSILTNCSREEKLARQFGFQRLDAASAPSIVRLITPDIAVFIVSLVVFLVCRKHSATVEPHDVAVEIEEGQGQAAAAQGEGELGAANPAIEDEGAAVAAIGSSTPPDGADATKTSKAGASGREGGGRGGGGPVYRREKKQRSLLYRYIDLLLQLVTVAALAAAAVVVPSGLTAIYILLFLLIGTVWAIHKSFDYRFIFSLVLVYTGLYLLLLYLYQFEYSRTIIDPTSLTARVLGLLSIVEMSCSQPTLMIFTASVPWSHRVAPIVYFILYWLLAINTRRRCTREHEYSTLIPTSPPQSPRGTASTELRRKFGRGKKNRKDTEKQVLVGRRGGSSSEGSSSSRHHTAGTTGPKPKTRQRRQQQQRDETHESLLEEHPSPSYDATGKSPVDAKQGDPLVSGGDGKGERGDGLDGGGGGGDEELDGLGYSMARMKSKHKQHLSVILTVVRFLVNNSYVASLIAMMAWGILYHSWFGLVFLLWACFIWMLPNSRKWCLRSSPLIVLLAEGLLLLAYACGFNVKDEIPEKIGDLNLNEVAVEFDDMPYLHNSIKIICLCFFWALLRQFIIEVTTCHQTTEDTDGDAAYNASVSVPLNDLPEGARGDTDEPKRTLTTEVAEGEGTVGAVFTISPGKSDDVSDHPFCIKLGNWMVAFLSKHWIILCGVMLLLMAIIGKLVIIRLFYMVFLLLWLLLFRISYTIWRVTLKAFWWIIIIYSMCCLLLIYVYQFPGVRSFLQQSLKLSVTWWSDVGLEEYKRIDLFMNLLVPTVCLVVVIIQNRFFHANFMKLTHLDRYIGGRDSCQPIEAEFKSLRNYRPGKGSECKNLSEGTQGEESSHSAARGGGVLECIKDICWRILRFLAWFSTIIYELFWKVANVHMTKVVFITMMCVSVAEPRACNIPFILLIALFMPIVATHRLIVLISHVWLTIVIFAKTIFQLNSISRDYEWFSNCTSENGTGDDNSSQIVYRKVDNAEWFGLENVGDTMNTEKYLFNYIILLAVLVVDCVAMYHQTQHYRNPDLTKPRRGIIFGETTRHDADKGIFPCLRFFANYFFYKFGLEICYMTTVIVITSRMDVFSVIYGILLIILLPMSRGTCHIIWPFYTVLLAILLPVQFLSLVGLPNFLCLDYPWSTWKDTAGELSWSNFRLWLYLPDFGRFAPLPWKLLGDFFQLLFAALQLRVFHIESSSRHHEYGGGDNRTDTTLLTTTRPIPVADFISKQTNYLDVAKSIIFTYFFWVALVVFCLAGLSRSSLFCLGYLIIVFILFWMGNDLLTKPLHKLLRIWNLVIGYNVFAIFIKVCLQFVGCVYYQPLVKTNCWLVQILQLYCIGDGYSALYNQKIEADSGCNMSGEPGTLAVDAICFICLLIQRRIFQSFYFQHVVIDLLAQNKLSSRGATMVSQRLLERVRRRREVEEEELQQIKNKVTKIRQRQEKLHKSLGVDVDHYKVIRSGDYYMFDDLGLDESTEQIAIDYDARKSQVDEGTEMEKLDDPRVSPPTDTNVGGGGDRTGSDLKSASGGGVEDTTVAGGEDVELEEKEESKLKLLINAIYMAFDSLLAMMEDQTREYRLVAQRLHIEKCRLKDKLEQQATDESCDNGEGPSPSPSPIGESATVATRTATISTYQLIADAEMDDEDDIDWEQLDDLDKLDTRSRFYRFFKAIGDNCKGNSEYACYFLLIINHLTTASFLSMPLPILVFTWGMLSIPRPSKRFWITVITYTMVIVIIKYIFQFNIWPWNEIQNPDVLWPPRILGIEQKDENFAVIDLILLLALFLHRSFLKQYGLWRESADFVADLRKVEETSAAAAYDQGDKGETNSAAAFDEEPTSSIHLHQESGDATLLPDDSHPSSLAAEDLMEEPKSTLSSLRNIFKSFFFELQDRRYKISADVYMQMFAFDFICFLLIVFGYQAFGPVTGFLSRPFMSGPPNTEGDDGVWFRF